MSNNTHTTYNLDEALSAGRQSIDAKWSKKTRRIVTASAIVVTLGAISGGLWAASAYSTPGLPRTAEEALAVLGTPKFERMSEDRKSAYAEEAGRLLRDLPEEDRRAMFRDEEQRDAMRALMEQRMADMARAIARGETPDFTRMFGDRPPRPPRDDADRQRQREEMTEEERAARRAEMQERMRERITESYKSGNAQNSALMGEMFRSGAGFRGPGGGPGGRGGGGGDRGGQGGGGQGGGGTRG
ncbi:MAG: hypothetical protein H6813_06270 [Phycisphaeraceae bacterium]|nr:hypothetical protein [Phycisphaeraceae bacterium]MCB9848076.1 hypothetical protein [Phycisphaeraceae bacterium]